MYRPQFGPRGVVIPPVVANAGDGNRYPAKLVNGVRNTSCTVRFTATVQVATNPATTLRNRGSVLALFEEIVLDENGTDKMILRPNVLRAFNESLAPSALSSVRAAAAIATYNLEEMVQLVFSSPLSLDPMETAFIEHDGRQALNVSFKLKQNLANALFTVGTAVVTITNVKAEVVQNYDKPTAAGLTAPLFIPIIRQQIDQVVGAAAQQPIYIRTPNLIRSLIMSTEGSFLGEVSDVMNGFALRGDYTYIYGPGEVPARHKLLAEELEFGGFVQSQAAASHFVFNFQRFGKLSECLNPTQDANIRFEVDVQPSASDVALGGTSSIRTTSFELFRDPAVCAPTVPFSF